MNTSNYMHLTKSTEVTAVGWGDYGSLDIKDGGGSTILFPLDAGQARALAAEAGLLSFAWDEYEGGHWPTLKDALASARERFVPHSEAV